MKELKTMMDYVETINNSNSQNYKVDELEKFFKKEDKNSNCFKLVKLVYDPNVNFYITEKQLKNATDFDKVFYRGGLEVILEFLINMSIKKYPRKEIVSFFNALDEDTRNFFIRCINKNLFDSVSIKVLEKAYDRIDTEKTLYPKFPYMRCSLMDKLKHINYPAYSQVKMDGTYVNIIFTIKIPKVNEFTNGVDVEIYSRQGKKFDLGENLKVRLTSYYYNKIHKYLKPEQLLKETKIVLMGEALIKGDDGKPLDRKTGNGLITSLSKQFSTMSTYEDKYHTTQSSRILDEFKDKLDEWKNTEDNIYFVIWDTMLYKHWQLEDTNVMPYSIRLDLINQITSFKPGTLEKQVIRPIETKIVNSYEEAYEHFLEMYKSGEEGTILKNMDLGWKDGTSNHQIKFKAVKECELKVTGYEMGSGKYSEGIGALLCESSDGLLKVSISGMTESERGLERADIMDASKGLKVINDFDFNKYTGKIITVEFNELIKAKDKEDYSLFLPRIKEFRDDKTEADDLEYIKGL